MTEDEAKAWIESRFGTAKVDRLSVFVDLLVQANTQQNLIAASTIPAIWQRHILDSAQLALLADDAAQRWCDVGSGPGLPGLVIAILHDADIWLVEPRARRSDFLVHVIAQLGLRNAHAVRSKAEAFRPADAMHVVTARAVAALPTLFAMCDHFTSAKTRFILPKGRSARDELALAHAEWQGVFHVERSVSDDNSAIIIADGVKRRCSASR